MKIFVIIPAFNESSQIGFVIDDLLLNGFENIVVVDDGSIDNICEIILDKYKNVFLLKHIVNRGQGASLATGVSFALNNNADIIVHFDADGQMQAQDINKLVEVLQRGEADVVVGSRFQNSQIPFLRKILLIGARLFNRYFMKIKVTDTTSGFRVMTSDVAKIIEIKHDRMAHCSQIMQDIHKKNLKVKEVPVNIKYTEYSLKKGQNFFDAFKVLWEIILGKFIK